MRLCLFLLVGLGLAVTLVAPVRAEVPEKYKPAIKKGLDWLVKQQKPDGSWTTAQNQYPVSMTALAGLALLMQGSTTGEGKYADNLKRASDWLIKKCQKGTADDGMLGSRQE